MNGSILIPTKFRLDKKAINVIVNDQYCTENHLWGEADFDGRTITLCRKSKNKVLKKVVREKTFYHELVHHILGSMGKEELKYDEEFVDLFSLRLYEYEKSKQ